MEVIYSLKTLIPKYEREIIMSEAAVVILGNRTYLRSQMSELERSLADNNITLIKRLSETKEDAGEALEQKTEEFEHLRFEYENLKSNYDKLKNIHEDFVSGVQEGVEEVIKQDLQVLAIRVEDCIPLIVATPREDVIASFANVIRSKDFLIQALLESTDAKDKEIKQLTTKLNFKEGVISLSKFAAGVMKARLKNLEGRLLESDRHYSNLNDEYKRLQEELLRKS